VNTYQIRLMMAEVRNAAGRKVAVEPIYVTVKAETPQRAIAEITMAFGSALTMGFERAVQMIGEQKAKAARREPDTHGEDYPYDDRVPPAEASEQSGAAVEPLP